MSERSYVAPKPSEEIAARFGDIHPPLDRQASVAEANRCLYCFDAPCSAACPTHINVPRFIKKIATGNFSGSAYTILDANILGASCARACPVEVLCEGACVMDRYNHQPIKIAGLQRFAMDTLYSSGAPHPFEPPPDTGESVALIGAGPASLACAAELRRRGIRANIYEARSLPGGLNTYGIAEYKLPLKESLREIDMLTQLGVDFHFDTPVDLEFLEELESTHDAVFLGVGLGAIRQLGIAGETLAGVTNALDFIAGYKAGEILTVPRRVAVIGAGNTAIDAAIAASRLGAEEVHLLYRRGPEQMSAFAFEFDHAKREGIRFLWHVQPKAIIGDDKVRSLHLLRLDASSTKLANAQPAPDLLLDVDLVILAIGQASQTTLFADQPLMGGKIQFENDRIVIDRATGQTGDTKFFAGGDCVNGGREVVDAVADGKRAGIGIARWLGAQNASN